MKIGENLNQNLIQQTETESPSKIQTPGLPSTQADALEQKQQELLIEQAQQQAAVAGQQQVVANEGDSGFDYNSLIPFGIGNWFDDKGCFASDLGKTLLSVACPIPFVGGMLADWGGEWLGNAIVNTADFIGDTVSDAASWISGAAQDVAGGVADAAGAVADAVSDGAQAVADAAGDVAGAVEDAAGAVAGAVSDALDW